MSQSMFKKRSRETEAGLPISSTDVREAKRFHDEETDWFCHLLQLEKTEAQQERECAPSEEAVNGVMRSLEEEIGATCYSSYVSSKSEDNSASSGISSGKEAETGQLASDSEVDLFYLLEASDDELGIPLSSVVDLKDQDWQSLNETSEGLLENHLQDLKSVGEIWHFEEDYEKNQQFALYDDAYRANQPQEYMDRDFFSQNMCFDSEFAVTWTLETEGFL